MASAEHKLLRDYVSIEEPSHVSFRTRRNSFISDRCGEAYKRGWLLGTLSSSEKENTSRLNLLRVGKYA